MSRGPTVVVIEDEPQIRRFVRAALEAEGCQVFEAETSKKGLIEAGTRKPDLLVLDLGLPDGDGVDFIHDLRGWSDVPVVVLSARSDERTRSPPSMQAPTTTSPSHSAWVNCLRGRGRRCVAQAGAARKARQSLRSAMS